MKGKKKALVTALCVALIAAGALAGTMAYFTDKDAATNTFTVGKVAITLDEAKVDEAGVPVDGAARVKVNKYHLIPGENYTKDPTVHVEANSTDCYVFVTVDNQIAAIEGEPTVLSQMSAKGWKPLTNGEKEEQILLAGVPVFYYEKDGSSIVAQSENAANLIVFETFSVSGEKAANNPSDGQIQIKSFQGKEITVNAYAVQAPGFDSPYEAWAATFGA